MTQRSREQLRPALDDSQEVIIITHDEDLGSSVLNARDSLLHAKLDQIEGLLLQLKENPDPDTADLALRVLGQTRKHAKEEYVMMDEELVLARAREKAIEREHARTQQLLDQQYEVTREIQALQKQTLYEVLPGQHSVISAELQQYLLESDLKMQKLQERYAKLEAMIEHDEMTGAMNLRGATRSFEVFLERAERDYKNFCMVLVDIDGLKKTNDKIGYNAGDTLLTDFVEVASEKTRIADNNIVARVGGDEFIILVTGTIDIARQIVDRIESDIKERNQEHKFVDAGISYGFSEYIAGKPKDYESMKIEAEIGLKQQKTAKNVQR
jgi:diguanylate cyclase (GGDEF)-like protein